MESQTLTRVTLSDTLRRKHGLKREEALEAIETVLEEIVQALQSGHEVKIPLFGVFFSREKKERLGRNPKTMKEAVISSRRVVSFRPSRFMKTIVTDGCKK